MLFDQLPLSVLAILMGVSCAIKHTALKRLVFTQWFQQHLWKRHWITAVSLVAVCGAVMIYLIFNELVGVPTACYWAFIDFCLTLGVGWYAHRVQFFEMESTKYKQALIIIHSAYTTAYVSFIWYSLNETA
jgi:hypothetical protein